MLQQIDHIGVVVKDAAQTAEVLHKAFGFQVIESMVSPQGDFRTTVVAAGGVSIEIIEPIGPTGGIVRFLELKGGGMHHVSFRVDDVEQELKSLSERGLRLVQDKPNTVGSSKVAFVHPSSTAGVLVELIERR